MIKKVLFIAGAILFLPQIAFAGSQSYATPGTYTFTVPSYYDNLTIQVWGGGGGGAGSGNGGTGGQSRFNAATPLIANGGGGGTSGNGGSGGSASGGTTNITGDPGGNGGEDTDSSDGTYDASCSSNGGGGGPGVYVSGSPGQGGSGDSTYEEEIYTDDNNEEWVVYCYSYSEAGGGGAGYSSRTYSVGQLTPGANITVVVGSGGSGGSGGGEAGIRGQVTISWDPCRVTGVNSMTFICAGTFTVPSYGTMTVEVWGGGGGGGAAGWQAADNATVGGNSTFNSTTPVIGNGGGRGRVSNSKTAGNNFGARGLGGSFSGGGAASAVGMNGNNGNVPSGYGGRGGDGGGTAGGDGGPAVGAGKTDGRNGYVPGGGGGGASQSFSNEGGGAGGGGYAIKTFTYGQGGAPTQGQAISVIVGNGGNGGDGGSWGDADGGFGARGEVRISWAGTAPPTCTLSFDTNPINQGGSALLTWSSTNATSFDITNIGPVDVPPGAGSTSVAPSATTVYTGTVTGASGTGNCNATLTVNPATTANLIGNGEADDTVAIFQNASISFSWSSTNATDCTLTKDPGTAPWSGSTTGTAGPSRTVGPYGTLGTYTYTLTCTGAGGSTAIDTVVVTVNPLDMCTDISGNQTILPGGCTGPDPSPVGACIPSGYYWSGTQCLQDVCTDIIGGQPSVPPGCTGPNPSPSGICLPAGYSWNGSICLAPIPTLTTGTFYADRVRSGTASTLHWALNDITGLTCTISPDPTDNSGEYSVGTANGSVATIVITQTKSYTLTCTNGTNSGSVTATVNILPAFQEI